MHSKRQIEYAILQVTYKNLLGGAALAIKKVRFRNGARNRVIETGLQIPLGKVKNSYHHTLQTTIISI